MTTAAPDQTGAIKDPSEWVTGGEPMIGEQDSYVHTLARQAGVEVGVDMAKAEAFEKIDELREKTGKKPHSTTRLRKPKKSG
ncbi:MAG: DUF3072 domain-containing protein [Planctomycetes bacterium]|nr:DUF3072 domain-containing protein [Planctomycetota bacterium]